MKIGVLGGGLAGISLAYFLQQKGFDVEVLEKEAECGGLCRSFVKNGFSYEYGGHIIFSKDNEILSLMVDILEDNVKKHYRNNKIWFKNRFVKYPFENGLAALDREDIFDCLCGFVANNHPKPKNFKAWLYHTFGDGLAEKYLIPYNEKIWNCKTAKMGMEWVERVPKPPVEDIIKSALGIETEGYTHQLYFYYPIEGGIQALVRAFESKLKKIRNNFAVKVLRRVSKKGWIVSDGKESLEYDRIVSCLPVLDLVKALDAVPPKIAKAARELKYNSLNIVMLGLNRTNLSDKFAIYFPQPELLFHRVCFHSYLGPWYTPEGKASVVAEITTNPGDGVHEMSDRQLIDRVVEGLDGQGIISKQEVCEADVKRIKYAYVVYDLKYQQKIRLLRAYFQKIKVPLCGRFAEFEYLNMDATIRHAMDLSKKWR